MFKFLIKGVVQGVGFRPYVYRTAINHGLVGYVKNTGSGVEIVVNDKDFISKLNDMPPLAVMTEYSGGEFDDGAKYSNFKILESTSNGDETILPPDINMCQDCLRELTKQGDRRHNYYFITCTNCGPRFTIIEDYPYDRPNTSMAEYEMCELCAKEYSHPSDRRYHAQTIACPECGPKLRLIQGVDDVETSSDEMTVDEVVKVLLSGEPVSIKGVGGFHICSITEDSAVSKIRNLLGRPYKPFAVMVKDVASAKKIAIVGDMEQRLLESPARPIVVLKKKKDSLRKVSELDSIGVMLPYTSLHQMLIERLGEPLVATSCNLPGEPVLLTEKIGRWFLTHERRIANRCDDSVVKVISGKTLQIRRSRGYTPLPVKLPIVVRDTIAIGAEINNAVACSKKSMCFLSQHIGDTSKLQTYEFLIKATERLVHLARLKPEMIAFDMHPQYNSASYARELASSQGLEPVPIQHHMAHVASVAAEYGLKDYVGIAADGTGYGLDGLPWGGEVFSVSDGRNFNRVASLETQPQLGGDFAALHPKKMLFGIMSKILSEDELVSRGIFPADETRLYLRQIRDGFNAPQTTSAGRVLDAVSALLGFCDLRTYDGRPAMVLEAKASKPLPLKPKIEAFQGRKILSTTELFRFLLHNFGEDKGRLAATAQMYLAEGLYQMASEKAEGMPVVASGGVCYNRMFTEYLLSKGVLINREVPAGDGGICFGQTYVANLMAVG